MVQLIWAMSCRWSITNYIPSWTGFNIQIREINRTLNKCLKVKEKLILNVIICVFDKAIYSKAVEIKWKYPERFQSCIPMLGIFHMLMMYLGIISRRYKDAGLKDVLIQSGVIAEGSMDKALSGKMYNRAVDVSRLCMKLCTG